MPEFQYEGGLSPNDVFNIKLDTQARLDSVLNVKNNFGAPNPIYANYNLDTNPLDKETQISPKEAIFSKDPDIRRAADKALFGSVDQSERVKENAGFEIKTPYDQAEKYLGETMPFSPLRDNEDFYYQNKYLQDNAFVRSAKNVGVFFGRVLPGAALKLGEGLGYAGAMITSIGSDNYWANVADNSMSKYLEGLEHSVNNSKLLSVYHSADYDNQGFFSKLVDGTFWTDTVADAVAFMGSAFGPSLGLGALGKIGAIAGEVNAFARPFSTVGRLGKVASSVGLGSFAEASTWALNTAMEAAQEGAGVFKDTTANLKKLRAEGKNNYTDEEIRKMAGDMAGNTVKGNFAVLALSNAYENTLFFKRGIGGTTARVNQKLFGESATLEGFKAGAKYYGKQALKGFAAEGLWEENAQLAIQRMNTLEGANKYFDDNDSTGYKFFDQYFTQIGKAFSGNDKEASESIGLGALIGIGAGVGFSKLHGERKDMIKKTKEIISFIDTARSNLFASNDIYKTDENGDIIFVDGKAEVDLAKLKVKQDAIENQYSTLSMTNVDEYRNSEAVQYETHKALASYVRSMANIGFKGIGERFDNLSGETAGIFGLDPNNINENSAKFKKLAENFEILSDKAEDTKFNRPEGKSLIAYELSKKIVKDKIYQLSSDNHIVSNFIGKHEGIVLDGLNKSRTLSNSSITEFPVEQLNNLLLKRDYTELMVNDPNFSKMAPVMQKYYNDRLKDLNLEIEDYKTNNESILKDAGQKPSGYYYSKNSKGEALSYPVDVFESQRKIAEFENVSHFNSHKIDLISHKDDWYENYNSFNKRVVSDVEKAAAAAVAAAEEDLKKSPFKGQKEHKAGDFTKLIRIAGKIVANEPIEDKPSLDLMAQYADLMTDLVPEYTNALEVSRKNIYTKRLKDLNNKRDKIKKSLALRLATKDAAQKEYLDILKDDKVSVKSLKSAVKKLQNTVSALEEAIATDQSNIDYYNGLIQKLEEEIEFATTQNLRDLIGNTKKEIAWLQSEILANTSLLKQVKKVLKALTDTLYELYDSIAGDKKVGKAKFLEDLGKGLPDALSSYEELRIPKAEKVALEAKIRDYNNLLKTLQSKLAGYEKLITSIVEQTNKDLDAKYKEISNELKKDAAGDPIENIITNSFNQIIIDPPSVNSSESQSDYNDEFIRPLTSKFFTSTFPRYDEIKDLPQSNINHFEFLSYLSDAKKVKEVKKKIGTGKLKILVVTKNNLAKYKLDELYKGNEIYWDDVSATARIELVHVLETDKGLFFVDKELNKIGKVGEKVDSNKITSVLLRAAAYKDYELVETSDYVKKYGRAKMQIALDAGINLRAKLLAAKNDILYNFDVTKGIINRQTNEDRSYVYNSVVGILLNEDQIQHNTVVVAKDKESNVIVNNKSITVPAGRPYIITRGAFEQLHAADVRFINDNQADTLVNVFANLSSEYIEVVEETMQAELKGRKIGEIAEKERNTILVKFNNKKGLVKFNKEYIEFIKSLTYFGTLKRISEENPFTGEEITREIPGKGKIYLKGSYIYFGKFRVDITDPQAFFDPNIKKFLLTQHHNVRFYLHEKDNIKKYIEYYMDGKTLKTREWNNYATYLLSAKYPDGSKRNESPVTTQIKTENYVKLEANNPPYLPYVSQSIILNEGLVEGVGKEDVVATTSESDDGYEVTKTQDETSVFNNSLTQQEEQQEEMSPMLKRMKEKQQEELAEAQNSISPMLQRMAEKRAEDMKENLPSPQEAEPESPIDNTVPNTFNKRNNELRVITNGFFKTEEDLEAVLADAKRMLPQFPVVRLKNAIQVTPTLRAFGEFTGDVINLWEGAEEGTLYHEIFEGVVNRILSNYEWNSIEKEFKGRKGSFINRENGLSVKYSEATPSEVKEELAEEFRHFKLTGELPSQKNTKTFFQVILDFIKSFFNNRATIDSLFNSIEEGKLSSAEIRDSNRFTSNYRIDNFPISGRDYHAFLQGFTSMMFNDIFQRPESLTNLSELGENDNIIYERLKAQLDAYYDEVMKDLDADYPVDTPDKEKNKKNKKERKQVITIIEKWEKIKDDWGNFVKYHKASLKKYQIEFEEPTNLTDEENDQRNRNDYENKPFKISSKNTASPSVKFLIGALLKVDTIGIKSSLDKIIPRQKAKLSSVGLNQMVNYDVMMLQVLKHLSGLNRIDLIEQKLREVSGITLLENTPEDRRKYVAERLTEEQSAMGLLYTRLFGNFDINEGAKWNLKVRFNNYVSKQSPISYIAMLDAGVLKIMKSTERPAYEKILRRIRNGITRNITDAFDVKKTAKGKVYTSKLTTKQFLSIDDFMKGDVTPGATRFKNFMVFLGLDKIVTPEYLNNASPELVTKLSSMILTKVYPTIVGTDTVKKVFEGAITTKKLDIQGYMDEVINIMDEIKPLAEDAMQHYNGDNELQQDYIVPSFISKMISEINNSNTLAELIERFPNMGKAFAQDSILLNQMFDENGNKTAKRLDLSYIEGLKADKKFKKTSKLEKHSRLGLQFIMSMSGFSYTLPADSETEWMFNMGEFVEFSNKMLTTKPSYSKIINEKFLPKLRSELQLIIDKDEFSRVAQLQNKYNDSDTRTIGESLRFFKDILSKDTANKIYKMLEDGKNPEEILTSNLLDVITKDILSYLSFKTNRLFDALVDNRIINELQSEEGKNTFLIQNLTNDLIAKFGGTLFSQSQVKNIVAYAVINSHIGAMEQYKLFYGDPAQYKQFEKRAKSLFSPIEMVMIDESGEHNHYLNNNENSATVDGKSVALPEQDLFRINYRDSAIARTVADLIVRNPATMDMLDLEILKKIKAMFAGKFEETNEVDGQSVGTLGFIKQILLKSGSRWTKEFEEFYQYDNALARTELSKTGKYTYTSEDLKTIDAEILEKYKENPPKVGPSPLKTLVASVRPDGTQDLLKHSIYPISYQLARGIQNENGTYSNFELMDQYLDMLNDGYDLLNFESAHKVGVPIDDENSITHIHKSSPVTKGDKAILDKKGKPVIANNPFVKTNLNDVGNLKFEISFRTLGIQVETQNSGKGQTFASQMSKDIFLNLMPDGIPTDFTKGNPSLSKAEIRKSWLSLPEQEKLKSKDYRLVKDCLESLKELKDKSMFDALQRYGIKSRVDEFGNITYYPADLEKLKKSIKRELERLEIDQNIMDSLDLNADKTAFLNSSESLPTYDTVSNIVWAIADKAINSMKVNGKSYIQVSSAFFNTDSRKAAYKDADGKWVTVNNDAEFQKAVTSGFKPVLTSSELSFYTYKDGDQEVQGMEVYLPHIYLQKVNDARKAKGLSKLSDFEMMKYLNDNPKLLEGIGFRIPTQATSSLEFFKIKGFLPEGFATSIVVPSELTTKAGSDFDVDKLNTYLNNWILNKEGLPIYEEYKDDINSHVADRYISFVNSQQLEYSDIADNYDLAMDYIETNDNIETNKRIIEGSKSIKDEAELDAQSSRMEGLKLFNTLAIPIKQQFYDKETLIKKDDITGVEKTLIYKEYVNDWIKEFQGHDFIILGYKNNNGNNEKIEVDAKQSIAIFNKMIANYDDYLDKMGLSKELESEYYAIKKDLITQNRILNINFKLKIAEAAAEANSILSYTEFSNLPLHLQNTRGAVENNYFKSIRNILKQPERLAQLLSINSMDNIINNKNAVLEARGLSTKEPEINHTNLLDIDTVSTKRHDTVTGKSNIGIGATGMTNHANSQLVGIGITEGTVKKNDQWIMTLNGGDISLPFESIKVENVNNYDFISLSSEVDSEGEFIMDKISGYINGFVDVAKEPHIIEMGMHKELAGIYILLERIGLTGEQTALFLYQPIIREYLKELIFIKNKEFGLAKYRYPKDLAKDLVAAFAPSKKTEFKQIYFTNDQLKDMIKKGEDMKTNKKLKWTEDERHMQYMALVNFLKINLYTQSNLENQQGSNHDTSKIRSTDALLLKDLKAELAMEGNVVMSPTATGYKDGVLALREGTFIQRTIDAFNIFDKIFSEINLFALQKGNPKTTLNNIARREFRKNSYISADNFVLKMKEYRVSMIDHMINKYGADSKNVRLSDYTRQLFKPEQTIELADGTFQTINEHNISNQWVDIQNKYPTLVQNNFFLSNLIIVEDTSLGVYTIELDKNTLNSDVLTNDLLINDLRELTKYPQEDIKTFAKALIVGSIIQYGAKFQRGSTTKFIPIEEYSKISQRALEVIDTEDFSTFEEQVQRESVNKRDFVQEVQPKAMSFLLPDGTFSKPIWHSIPKEDKLAGRKDAKVSERRFMVPMGKVTITKIIAERRGEDISQLDGQDLFTYMTGVYADKANASLITELTSTKVNSPILVWSKYEDEFDEDNNYSNLLENAAEIIVVEMVKPEYLMWKTIEENRYNKQVIVLTPQAITLIKKKDDSWKYNQLYKLVGADGNTPSVMHRDKKEDKKTKETTIHLSLLYKPINGTGVRNFNEAARLTKDDDGNVMGKPSVLIPNNKIVEKTDLEIHQTLMQKKNPKISNIQLRLVDEVNALPMAVTPPIKLEAPLKTIVVDTKVALPLIAKGIKTVFVRSEKNAGTVGVRVGTEETRIIGGEKYNITNRGLLTIEEAGGYTAMIDTYGITEDQVKFGEIAAWVNNNTKMYVYDIAKINKLSPDKVRDNSSEVMNIYAGTNENAILSNLATRPFTHYSEQGGITVYDNVEQAFQMAKLDYSSETEENKELVRKIADTKSGTEAKKLGKLFKGLDIKAWDSASSSIMKDFMKQSFEGNDKALTALLATGNATLTHTQDNSKWGKEFPRLLMEVRAELRPPSLPEIEDDNAPCE